MSQTGKHEISVQDNVIYVEYIGAADEYSALIYERDMHAAIKDITVDKFAIVINLLRFSGGTPEAQAIHNRIFDWLTEQGLAWRGVISVNELHIKIARSLQPALCRQDQQVQIFSSLDKAEEWVRCCLNAHNNDH